MRVSCSLPLALLAVLADFETSWALPNPLNALNKLFYESMGGRSPFPPLPIPKPRPLVVWHGLGDTYASAGMTTFIQEVKTMHPGIFVHAAYINTEPTADQRAGWFGNVNQQVELVAQQIAEIEELQGGFDAIGFSQAGQFLRAYVERYNHPPVRNLITFGAQHMGVAGLPRCNPTDLLCRTAYSAARSGVYTPWAQSNLVQAQYFRDHTHYDNYLASNVFLTDINNEISRNETYAIHFKSLNSLVLVLFDQDKTVVPKESAWFGAFALPNQTLPGEEPGIIPMNEQPLYTEDWIGLRTLDENKKLHFVTCQGDHMELSEECWMPVVSRWVGNIEISPPKVSNSRPFMLLQDW